MDDQGTDRESGRSKTRIVVDGLVLLVQLAVAIWITNIGQWFLALLCWATAAITAYRLCDDSLRTHQCSMRFRKLRIAWSVGCAIACVLLLVLWVRSYQRVDDLNGIVYGSLQYDLSSLSGCVGLEVWANTPLLLPQFDSYPNTESDFSSPYFVMVGRSEQPGGDGFVVLCPYWCILMSGIAVGVAPWLRWRFTLRTLLIATTLLTVVLGLIVWSIK